MTSQGAPVVETSVPWVERLRVERLRVSPASGGPRLLRLEPGVETYLEYVAAGGYGAIDSARIPALALDADVCGRGGAGFPLGRKLAVVAASGDPHRVVVANGEEGEPGSVKDRLLLRTRPHLVLDGLRLAAEAVAATELHVYVSDPGSAEAVASALAETPSIPRVVVTTVAPAYVAGEESAVVRFLDGGPALPTAKPPRAYEVGVRGHPTVVSNVETLAQLAAAVTRGAADYGSGSVLATISGDRTAAYVVEAARGSRLADVVDGADVQGVLCGGLFGGLQPASVLDLPLDHAAMREAGTSLGCGAFYLLSTSGCPVDLVCDAVTYLSRQSSRQCGSCFNGTDAMAAVLDRLCRGEADVAALGSLTRWTTQLRGRGNCALLDAACELAGSLVVHWPGDVQRHLAGAACSACAARDGQTDTRLRVSIETFLQAPIQERS
jgi:NADH:ubiquinone oxidoreductase subunit F (NADH-binding)